MSGNSVQQYTSKLLLLNKKDIFWDYFSHFDFGIIYVICNKCMKHINFTFQLQVADNQMILRQLTQYLSREFIGPSKSSSLLYIVLYQYQNLVLFHEIGNNILSCSTLSDVEVWSPQAKWFEVSVVLSVSLLSDDHHQ